jgi:hypothetical protein
MCRRHLKSHLGHGVHPPAEAASACKDERMRSVTVNHGQFKITVERSVGYRLPVHVLHYAVSVNVIIDLHQDKQVAGWPLRGFVLRFAARIEPNDRSCNLPHRRR